MGKVYYYMILLACIVAILFWRHYKHTNQWIFLPYLIYVAINETLALVIIYVINNNSANAEFLYNSYLIISFTVYYYWFWKILDKPNWFFVLYIIPCFVFIYEFFTKDFLHILFDSFYLTQAIFILFCALWYFKRLLQKNEAIEYYKLQSFWIVAGLLFFYIGAIPLIVLQKQMVLNTSYIIALGVLNIILYGFYIIGFIVSKKRNIV